jgi:uncharacterized protein (TIGR02001 family)
MFKARVLMAGVSLAVASAAHAGLSVTPTVTSDYDFRGITQTAVKPALQVGVDYGTGGFHAGAWASNIEWGPSYDGKSELDLLADYTFGSDEGAKVNVGIVDYMYPSMTDQNTIEPWITISHKWVSGSLRYSNDWFNLGTAVYVELNGTFPIGKSGFNITAHVGNSSGDAWKGIEYTDYALGVTKGFGNFTGAIKLVSSNAPELTAAESLAFYGKKDVFKTGDRVLVSISTTLPWAKE